MIERRYDAWGRIVGIILRHYYLYRGSIPRIIELAYWPVMQIMLWGFITQYFQQHSSLIAQAGGLLLAGVLLWDVLFRGQLGVSVSFLEELWSRNLGQMFVSPLRPQELAASLMAVSLLRTIIGLSPATLIAWLLYQFDITSMGLSLVAFFGLLMAFSWAIGIAVCAMLLRFGLGAESLAWVSVFALAPVSAVYYPVEILPTWLEYVALFLPSAHVFEGMRSVLLDGYFAWDHFLWAAGLNLAMMVLAMVLFVRAFNSARVGGRLLQSGE
ncbi:MAG: ABC transporter permease [Alphaproteobacteria bacterium]|jgi:ABC-2 type transport system permease protein